MFTMVDRAPNFTVLCPVTDTTAKATALALLYNWITVYEIPRHINSDLGTSYTARLMHEVLSFLA